MFPAFDAPGNSEPLVYLDTLKREQLASMRNNHGETPLHALARAHLVNFAEAGKRPHGAAGLPTLSGRTSFVSMQVLLLSNRRWVLRAFTLHGGG